MDFDSVCRTCLKNNHNLNPIFMCVDNHEKFSNAIYLGTGVHVKYNDSLPQNMCTDCMKQLNNALKFRKQCQEVETQLLTIKSGFETSITDSIVINEISKTNSFEKPTKTMHLTAQNCSNLTIKQEYVDLKTESTDMDEDKPLKFFLNEETPITYVNVGKTMKISKQEAINTEYLNNEGSNSFENEEDLTANDLFTDKIEIVNKNTNKEQYNCVIYSRKPKNNKTKVEQAKKLLKNNDNLKINDTEQYNDDEFLTEMSTNTKLTEVPYSYLTESVTKSNRVVCKLCQKDLSIRSIDTHITRRHPGADQRKIKCELCDKYVMRDRIIRHRMMMHGNPGFKCGYCKSEFDTKEILVEHVPTCTAKKRKRKVNRSGRELAECDVCHKSMQKASLKKHKAVKHAGLRPVCEHCGKSFGNKFRLTEHYRAKHGYEKFHCRYCDFRSAGIMGLRNHERRHRGEKPFVCETCGAKFHASYLLAQHKHSHRTDKLFKCDLCPSSFKAKNSLHMHKLTCHSDTLYTCTLCARSYKCRYYAKKHVRHAHSSSETTPLVKVMNQIQV